MDNSGFNSINSSSIMTNQTLSMDNIASGTSSISSETAMQTFLVYALDGTPISLSFQKLDDWYFYFVKMSTIFGAQLGATALLFGLLLMLGRPARLRSPVYLLNVISLIFNFFRCLFNILYFNGPFAEAFVFFTNAPYVPSSAYGISVAAEVFATLLLLTIETSLVMQANVVCSTLRKQTRTAITGTLSLVAALTVSLRLALMIYKIKILLDSTVNFDEDPLVSASDIMVAISICIFSGVFTFKLGAAVLSRRKLGLKQFGPMQVIFIMGCQTSIIPAIFCILEYTLRDSGLGSMTLTVVVLSLPLSALWASTATDRKTVSLIPRGRKTAEASQNSASSTMLSATSQSSFVKLAAAGGKTESTISSEPRVSDIRDWDVEHGIKVDRSFSVSRTR